MPTTVHNFTAAAWIVNGQLLCNWYVSAKFGTSSVYFTTDQEGQLAK